MGDDFRVAASPPGTTAQDTPRLAVPELVPVAEFLEQSLPFNDLPKTELYQVVADIVVQYHCRGDVFNRETEEAGLRIVRSGACSAAAGAPRRRDLPPARRVTGEQRLEAPHFSALALGQADEP